MGKDQTEKVWFWLNLAFALFYSLKKKKCKSNHPKSRTDCVSVSPESSVSSICMGSNRVVFVWAITADSGVSQVVLVVKNPQCRRQKRYRFSSWVGKILWRRAWQTGLVFLPGDSPRNKEPGRLWPVGSQRVREDWSDWAHTHVDGVSIPEVVRVLFVSTAVEIVAAVVVEVIDNYWDFITYQAFLYKPTHSPP